jgi:hypothetical protein
MENTIMEIDNVSSICIPRVFDNIGQDRIQEVFNKLNIFVIDRVDVIQKQNEKGEKFKRVFVHIKEWLQHSDAQKAKERLLAGKELKIVYDDPWFWKVAVNKWVAKPKQKPVPVPVPKPKIRIDYEDSEDNRVPEKMVTETRYLKAGEKKEDNRRPYKERSNDHPHRKQRDDRPTPMEPKRNKYDRNDREKHYKKVKVPEVKQEKEEKEEIVEAIVDEIVDEIMEVKNVENKDSVMTRIDINKCFQIVNSNHGGELIEVFEKEKQEVEVEEEETISIIKKPRAIRTPEQKEMERRANALLAKLCS